MTQCTALRGKLEAAIFPPRMHFKVWEQKKEGQSTVKEQRPERHCALQTGPLPGP